MISDFTQASSELHIVNSRIESDRFELTVARLNISIEEDASDQQVIEICQNSYCQLLILRYPTTRVKLAQKLSEIKERVVYQADTLVYFAKDIDSLDEKVARSQDWLFREARSSDSAELSQLSKVVFEEYPNHYRANDSLSSDAIRDGYAQWAQVGLEDLKKLTVFVENVDAKVIGFALISFDGDTAEIELNGIHPQAQGRGAYGSLLSWLSTHLATRGVKKLCISTQIQNERVIRAWIRAGFNLEFSLNTVHLMQL
jgi:ribosomal protein S18 acetylase RimI-like enzyme